MIDSNIKINSLLSIYIERLVYHDPHVSIDTYHTASDIIVTNTYIWFNIRGLISSYSILYDLKNSEKSLLIITKQHGESSRIINDQLVILPTDGFRLYNLSGIELPIDIDPTQHSSLIFNLETLEIRGLTIPINNIHQIVLAKNKSLMIITEEDGKVHFFDPKVSHLLIQGITPTTSIITKDLFVELDPVLSTSLKLATEAVEFLPEMKFAPGSRIFVPRLAASTIAQLEPEQTAQYIPPAYQELYNVCTNPDLSSKQALLAIAQRMGATNILPTDPMKLNQITNGQICATLLNFVRLQQQTRALI